MLPIFRQVTRYFIWPALLIHFLVSSPRMFAEWLKNNPDFYVKTIPFLISFVIGIALLVFGFRFNSPLSELFISLSANFLTIPLAFLAYELVKNKINSRLNFKIYRYVVQKVDSDLIDLLKIIAKRLYSYEQLKEILYGYEETLLTLTEEEIKKHLLENEYLYFQLNIKIDINKLHMLLQNDALMQRLSNEQVIALIDVVEALEAFSKNNSTELIKLGDGRYKISDNYQANCREDGHHFIFPKEGKENKFESDHGFFTNVMTSECELLLWMQKYKKEEIDYQVFLFKNVIDAVNNWRKKTGPRFI